METEMITLEINGKSVTVPKGTTILNAAKAAHIKIPTLCYHPDLKAGAVLLDSRGTETGRMHAFVKPHFYPKQAKDAYDFCMITEKEMKKAIEFPEMVRQISALYTPGNCYFVTWGNEDFRVLEIGCQRHGIENPVRREDCLDLALAYRLWKDDSYTTGLKAAAEALETDSEGLWHTAYDDAFNTGERR